MAKISAQAKQQYSDRIKEYKQEIEKGLGREKNLLQVLESDETGAAYKRISLAQERMALAAHYLVLNRLSLSLLGVKNEGFLNDGRKSCYQSVIYLEDVVSNLTDVPYSDYEEKVAEIGDFDVEKRYDLVRKLGFTIQSIEDEFGERSKWRWSFVELEGRFATVAKNLLNLKTLVKGLDPRAEGYESRLGHLSTVKHLLQKSAERYREKYEVSTSRMDDFKQAIAYLGALRRLHAILGEAEQAENVKRKIDVWRSKMEDDDKRTQGQAAR
jgi:hypothetical protein